MQMPDYTQQNIFDHELGLRASLSCPEAQIFPCMYTEMHQEVSLS
jgi:hypothetical protein